MILYLIECLFIASQIIEEYVWCTKIRYHSFCTILHSKYHSLIIRNTLIHCSGTSRLRYSAVERFLPQHCTPLLEIVVHHWLELLDQSGTRLLLPTDLLDHLHILNFGLHVTLLHEFELVLLTIFEDLVCKPAVGAHWSAGVSFDVIHEVVDYFIESTYFL
jgi:hypothetical protein